MTTNSVRNVSPLPTIAFVTIGVYGFAAERFFAALQEVGVDTVRDIRRRRGVARGRVCVRQRVRLQARLAELHPRHPPAGSGAHTGPASRQADADRVVQIAKRDALGPGVRRRRSGRMPGRLRCRGVRRRPGPGHVRGGPALRRARAGRVASLAAGPAASTRSQRQHHACDASITHATPASRM